MKVNPKLLVTISINLLCNSAFGLKFAPRSEDIYKYDICFLKKDLPSKTSFKVIDREIDIKNETGSEFILYKKKNEFSYWRPKNLNEKHLPVFIFNNDQKVQSFNTVGGVEFFLKGFNILAPVGDWKIEQLYHGIKDRTFNENNLPRQLKLPLTFYVNDEYFEPNILVNLVGKSGGKYIDIDSLQFEGKVPVELKFNKHDLSHKNLKPDLQSVYYSFGFFYHGSGKFLFIRKFDEKIKYFDLIKDEGGILYISDEKGKCFSYNGSYRYKPLKSPRYHGRPYLFSAQYELIPHGYTNTGNGLFETECTINPGSIDFHFDVKPKRLLLKTEPTVVNIPETDIGEISYKIGKKLGNIKIIRRYYFNSRWQSEEAYNKGRRRTIDRLHGSFNIKDMFTKDEVESSKPKVKIIENKSSYPDEDLLCIGGYYDSDSLLRYI